MKADWNLQYYEGRLEPLVLWRQTGTFSIMKADWNLQYYEGRLEPSVLWRQTETMIVNATLQLLSFHTPGGRERIIVVVIG